MRQIRTNASSVRPISRREFLSTASGGFGAIALAGMMADSAQAAPMDPLAARAGHFPARADRVIFLYSTGGVSQVDTFDHKPQLAADHGKSITASRWLSKPGQFQRFLIRPRWAFKQYGQSGTWVSDLFPQIGSGHHFNDVCVPEFDYHCDSDGHQTKRRSQHILDRHAVRSAKSRFVGELWAGNVQSQSAVVHGTRSGGTVCRSSNVGQRLSAGVPSRDSRHSGQRTAAQSSTASSRRGPATDGTRTTRKAEPQASGTASC